MSLKLILILKMSYFIKENFFTNDECRYWITKIDGMEQRSGIDNRYNLMEREVSDELCKRCLVSGIGSGRITLIKYRKESDGMKKHTDLIIEPGVKYTGVVYLNDSKGDTVLYLNENKISIEARKGRLLLFDVSIPHKALPPLEEKYVLLFRIIG